MDIRIVGWDGGDLRHCRWSVVGVAICYNIWYLYTSIDGVCHQPPIIVSRYTNNDKVSVDLASDITLSKRKRRKRYNINNNII